MQKTIFISIYDGDTEKNVLRSGVLSLLKSRLEEYKIILLIRSAKRLNYYKDNFADDQVKVELLPPAGNKLELIFNHVGWNSIPTYSVFLRRHDLYLSHKNKIRYGIERILGFFGKSKMWRELIRFSYYLIPDDYASELFERYKPSLLFSPNMFSAEDCRLLKAAKKRKIMTITTVKSWDVLTTKAFTRVKADKVLVFNDYNKAEAIKIGDYNSEDVVVTGFPQFDLYTDETIYLTRDDFFKRIGVDPKKRLILFAVPGDWKNPYTYEVMIGLDRAIEDGKIVTPVHVLARLHPKYPAKAEKVKNFKHTVLDRPGTYFDNGQERSLDTSMSETFKWTFSEKDIIHLANSIYHSDIVINTESTMTLDAAALDKPVVLIGYDGTHKLSYFESIIRNYDRNHYMYVMQTKGVRLAKSEDDLISQINAYLANPALDIEGRKELRNRLVFKTDGKSSERVAESIINML